MGRYLRFSTWMNRMGAQGKHFNTEWYSLFQALIEQGNKLAGNEQGVIKKKKRSRSLLFPPLILLVADPTPRWSRPSLIPLVAVPARRWFHTSLILLGARPLFQLSPLTNSLEQAKSNTTFDSLIWLLLTLNVSVVNRHQGPGECWSLTRPSSYQLLRYLYFFHWIMWVEPSYKGNRILKLVR